MVALPPGYSIEMAVPSVADYQRLRAATGLSPFAEAAVARGLAGSYLGAVLRCDGQVVGMGRVSGDGGLFFQLTDIAVLPEHQNQGLGSAIVELLLDELAARIDAPAYVSLIADGPAARVYAKHGFEPVAPKSQGMARWLGPGDS
jgi:ribosomal protein S18 acetylase RimI-like enzyme